MDPPQSPKIFILEDTLSTEYELEDVITTVNQLLNNVEDKDSKCVQCGLDAKPKVSESKSVECNLDLEERAELELKKEDNPEFRDDYVDEVKDVEIESIKDKDPVTEDSVQRKIIPENYIRRSLDDVLESIVQGFESVSAQFRAISNQLISMKENFTPTKGYSDLEDWSEQEDNPETVRSSDDNSDAAEDVEYQIIKILDPETETDTEDPVPKRVIPVDEVVRNLDDIFDTILNSSAEDSDEEAEESTAIRNNILSIAQPPANVAIPEDFEDLVLFGTSGGAGDHPVFDFIDEETEVEHG